jgi:hypothetical protein
MDDDLAWRHPEGPTLIEDDDSRLAMWTPCQRVYRACLLHEVFGL